MAARLAATGELQLDDALRARVLAALQKRSVVTYRKGDGGDAAGAGPPAGADGPLTLVPREVVGPDGFYRPAAAPLAAAAAPPVTVPAAAPAVEAIAEPPAAEPPAADPAVTPAETPLFLSAPVVPASLSASVSASVPASVHVTASAAALDMACAGFADGTLTAVAAVANGEPSGPGHAGVADGARSALTK